MEISLSPHLRRSIAASPSRNNFQRPDGMTPGKIAPFNCTNQDVGRGSWILARRPFHSVLPGAGSNGDKPAAVQA
jgi:hypothetical protein